MKISEKQLRNIIRESLEEIGRDTALGAEKKSREIVDDLAELQKALRTFNGLLWQFDRKACEDKYNKYRGTYQNMANKLNIRDLMWELDRFDHKLDSWLFWRSEQSHNIGNMVDNAKKKYGKNLPDSWVPETGREDDGHPENFEPRDWDSY